MRITDVRKIGVAGAGTMGAGIAQLAAMAGFDVILYDKEPQAFDRARQTIESNLDGAVKRNKIKPEDKPRIISRICMVDDLNLLTGEVIIEAIIENAEIKRALFAQLTGQLPSATIIASNTSSIPITLLAAGMPNPGRFIGMHFFYPAHIMKLVEVISGIETAGETVECIKSLAEKMGKQVVMAKDSPGFIVNRVARHYYVESLKILEENVTSFEVIDELLEATGFRMGPFKLMDHIGMDTNFKVTESMFQAFFHDPKFRPSRIQQLKVIAGHLGVKTGRGFYNYDKS